MRRLGPGDMFGELALIFDLPRSANVWLRADATTVLWELERDAFDECLHFNDDVCKAHSELYFRVYDESGGAGSKQGSKSKSAGSASDDNSWVLLNRGSGDEAEENGMGEGVWSEQKWLSSPERQNAEVSRSSSQAAAREDVGQGIQQQMEFVSKTTSY